MKDAIPTVVKAVKYLLVVMVLAVPFALSTSVPQAQAVSDGWFWGVQAYPGCPSNFMGNCYDDGNDCEGVGGGSTGCYIVE